MPKITCLHARFSIAKAYTSPFHQDFLQLIFKQGASAPQVPLKTAYAAMLVNKGILHRCTLPLTCIVVSAELYDYSSCSDLQLKFL